jgi:hypothetical protein
VRLDVIDAVHQQRLAGAGAAALVVDLLRRAGHHLVRD